MHLTLKSKEFIMSLVLYILCFFHATFAAIRPLSEDEAVAFETVFGTRDMKKLLEIEKNPLAYWEERAKALKDETISHSEFCQTYTHEIGLFLKKLLREPGATAMPWFSNDIGVIEDTIKLKIPEDHPAYKTIVTTSTAIACDLFWQPEKFSCIATKTNFERYINDFMHIFTKGKRGFLSDISPFINGHDFNARLRWSRNDAGLSIFDCLILLSNQEYLCHAMSLKTRTGFAVHDTQHNTLIGSGLNGGDSCMGEFSYPLLHDALIYAGSQYRLERHLGGQYGLSQQKYFRQCFNKDSLMAGDIISLGQQVLGCFYQFRESPAVQDSWDPDNMHSCIFPKASQLIDGRLAKVVPYFMHCDLNWHTQTLEPTPIDLDKTHLQLQWFIAKFCGKAGLALLSTPTFPSAAA